MSEFTDKAKGYANEAAGKVKQAIGDVTNNAELQAKGVAQEVEGKAQVAKGDVKGAVKDVADKF